MLSKPVFYILSCVVWAIVGIQIMLNRGMIVASVQEHFADNWQIMLALFGAIAFFLGLVVHSSLADALMKADKTGLAPADVKAMAEARALLAQKEGRMSDALQAYESAGMLSRALDIAHQVGDKPALARLSAALGKHDRARKYYLELEEWELAAQSSSLLGDIRSARECYMRAAREQEFRQAIPSAVAGLCERAGDLPRAAALYEQAQEFQRAADCFGLIGDAEKEQTCLVQAKAIEAVERRMRQSRYDDSTYLKDLEKGAHMLETAGDLLGAAQIYAQAQNWEQAARVFERFEEWERAARAYERAEAPDKAAQARSRISSSGKPADSLAAKSPARHGLQSPIPAPGAQLSRQDREMDIQKSVVEAGFPRAGAAVSPGITLPDLPKPILPSQPKSAGAAHAASASEILPEARDQIMRFLREGNFTETARAYRAAGDLVMAAAFFEQANDFASAAQVYQELGNAKEAIACLRRAGNLDKAAVQTTPIQAGEAVETLIAEMLAADATGDSVSLCELLISLGRHAQALEILRTRLVGESLAGDNADVLLKFAGLFEKHGALKEALAVHHLLLTSKTGTGVVSPAEQQSTDKLGGAAT